MAKDDFDLDFDFEKEYGLDPKLFMNDDAESDPSGDQELTDDFLAEEVGSDGQYEMDKDLDAFLNMGMEDSQEDDAGYSEDDSIDPPEFFDEALDEDLPDDEAPQTDYTPEPDYDQDVDTPADPPEEEPKKRRRRKEPKPVKPAAPNLFTKFYDLYFAPVMNKELLEPPQDPENSRRRRRKSKAQIFKEAYLPAIIVCLCLILVMSFVLGSLSNFIAQRQIDKEAEQSRLEATQNAQELAETQRLAIMEEAEQLAAGYDYEGAIQKLDSFADLQFYPDMAAKRSEYASAQSQLVEYQDPTQIPNFSFHPLIVDSARAFADEEYGGSYNRNFVLLSEFTQILNTLYNNGYVLVDFNSFTEYRDGNILTKSIYLPQGKKPMMLTETLVNYFQYMVDPDKNGTPDANGAGFANKLVLDSNGDIKAEYVDSSGNTLVGDYDLVPILESFIKEHPDFSYQGARAILAATGDEGIFGYRCNTSYIATVSQTFYDEQVAGAKVIVQALRDKGYTLACHTYDNGNYAQKNATQIQEDLQKWTQQITPIIGEVDTFVFARASNITDYSGSAFDVMYNAGFRYFVSNADTPSTQVSSTYVRQNRLMVTGNALQWKADTFTTYFDTNTIIDLTARGGSVPNG